MTEKLKLQSEFTRLDVKGGRRALERALAKGQVPVTIEGVITCPWGADDGTSREFEVRVTSVKVKDE